MIINTKQYYMEKLPEIQSLRNVIIEILSSMSVGETREYDTTNRNFVSFRQTLYGVIKEKIVMRKKYSTESIEFEFLTKMNRKANLLTIIRIK